MTRLLCIILASLLALPLIGSADGPSPDAGFLLHFNGVSGQRACDTWLLRGIQEAGFKGTVQAYDWSEGDEGLVALLAFRRNREEAVKAGKVIEQQWRKSPKGPIYLTSHSGGAGILVWAMESLPEDVMVDSVVLIAPALSPQYDLSAALHHVRGKVYVFSSPFDKAVLGTGTKLLGTIDRIKCESAGLNGFKRPAGADEEQYRKVVPQPYQRDWIEKYDNNGTHIGGMGRTFAREYIGKLLLTGRPPQDDTPSTRPSAPHQTAINRGN